MPRLPWSDFVRNHPHAHLVAAFLPETEEIGTRHTRAKSDVLISRIRLLAPSGAYATAIVREGGHTEIHCAFATQADATAFAGAMKAKVVRRNPDYASERLFRFDDAVAEALRAALPTIRSVKRERQRVGEDSRDAAKGHATRR